MRAVEPLIKIVFLNAPLLSYFNEIVMKSMELCW